VTRRWPGARWLIGMGLLVPAMLLIEPAGVHAESRSAKIQPKRTTPKTPSEARAYAVPAAHREERCVHVVRRGDSLGRIGSRYQVTRRAIIAGNDLGNAGGVKIGQRVSIPGCKATLKRRAPLPSPVAVELDDGLLLALVGPQRVPTRLYVAVPEISGETIEFGWPVDGPIASNFGRRHGGWHAGIDIKADMGTPVRAVAAGTVSVSGWAPFYGRIIKIQHPNGFVTVYAHNNENLVRAGDDVRAGAVIATVGRSGRASAEHLHFEIRRDGMAFNPVYLLEAREDSLVLASAGAEPLDDDGSDSKVP